MADLKLKRVVLRNWMKFKSVDLEFPECGMVMVTGINAASGGALQSVGSGKTGLGEAVSRALYGVQGRYVHLKQFSADKRGNTYVRVEAVYLDKPLVVEIGYQCKELNPKSEALRFTYDGKAIERGTIAQTRDELTKLLMVSPLLASWTVFLDGDKIKFDRLTQGDSVDLVMSALRQPPWTQYHEKTKAAMNKFRQVMAKDEATHEQAVQRVQDVETEIQEAKEHLAEAQDDYDEAVAAHKKEQASYQTSLQSLNESVAGHRKEQKELESKMQKLEKDKATAHHQLEIKQHEIDERIRVLKLRTKPLRDAMNLASTSQTENRVAYTNYRDAKRVCPTCNRPMGDKLDAARLRSLQESYENAAAAFKVAETALHDHEAKIEAVEDEGATVLDQINQLGVKYGITELSRRHESLTRTLNQALSEAHMIEVKLASTSKGPSDAALKVAQNSYTEKQKALKKAKEALAAASESFATAQATLKVMDYWNVAFSPYGIPNMVLREAIAPLNAEARRVSTTMTGGTIEVVYSTTRELASGMEKAQLNIEVNNRLGSKDLAGSSKGEGGLTNFIISETLSNVGQVSRRVGYRWYDEIVPHQDPKVCHAIYEYLSQIAHNLGILIFMVDHNPVVANYADYFLVVEKKGTPDRPENVIASAYWRR